MAERRSSILFVDDEAHVLSLLTRIFEEEHDCVAASSGAEALRLLEARRFDLLVTDQKMPGMTGVELIERARERAPELTAILLTAYAEPRDVIDAINKGQVFRYVQKPWELADLLVTVRNALDQSRLRRDNRVLLDELQKRVKALALIADVAKEAALHPSPDAVVRSVVTRFGEIVGYDLAASLVVEGSAATLDLIGRGPVAEENLVDAREAVLELFRAASGQPLGGPTLAVRVSGVRPGEAEARRPLKSLLQVPLAVRGRVSGAVALFSFAEGAFRAEDEALLDQLANQTAEAIRVLEERLGAERARLSRMVEEMADGVIWADATGRLLVVNRAARTLLGLGGELPSTARELAESTAFAPFDLLRGRPGPHREDVEVEGRRLHSLVSPLREADGAAAGAVVVLRDVTEERALDRRKQEFVSVVSHELRTPLTAISGALDLVLNDFTGPINDKQRRYLGMARESADRLNAIVDDLLDLAKDDEGKLRMNFEVVRLEELARQAADRYQAAALERTVALTFQAPAESIRVLADPGRLGQVFNNLLTNSLKFTPKGGRIDVAVFRCSGIPGFAGLSVQNSGEPIAEEELERIFDRFEQGATGRVPGVRGTGLGLSICRSIVHGHGGWIWADPVAGARFVAVVPLEPSKPDPREPAARVADPATVLVVDDEQEVRDVLKGLLLARGHTVFAASGADEALAIARRRRPDLVCIDVHMPGIDGLKLAEILRHDPETRGAPLLFLSSPDERESAFRSGAQAFLGKPVDAGRLFASVESLVAARRQARSGGKSVLVVDDDPAIRAIAAEILAGLGFRTIEASTLAEARVAVREQRPDLLLLDVELPDGEGTSLLEESGSERVDGAPPAIFVSARGSTADKVRALRLGAADYLVKPFDALELGARVETVLRRREQELAASPTTRLPGGISIEREVQRRLDARVPFVLVYLDLDNLKGYNDHYGWAKADGVIQQTGDLLRQMVTAHGSPGDFLGHIAGDDFVIVAAPAKANEVCDRIVEAFDRLIPLYYDKGDRERGYIEGQDRYGEKRRFPLMGISVASVESGVGCYGGPSDLARVAAEVKARAKAVVGSVHVRGPAPGA